MNKEQNTDTWSIKEVADALEEHGLIREQEPCEDAISRRAMHIELEKWIIYGEYKYSNATKYLYDRIDRLPPVSPQPKIGHWIESRCDMYECSECDHIYTDLSGERYGMHYCPNCGAKMGSEVQDANSN